MASERPERRDLRPRQRICSECQRCYVQGRGAGRPRLTCGEVCAAARTARLRLEYA